MKEGPLIAPLAIPGTDAAHGKHDVAAEGKFELPYAADALGHPVREAMKRLAGELLREGVLSHELVTTSAHALRRTFGTRAVARNMPIDVELSILGHTSLQTTSVYVRAEQVRIMDAAASYYGDEIG